MSNKPKIGIVGFGYIGAVIGASLTKAGYPVTGFDVSEDTVRLTNEGRTLIVEPGLDDMIRDGVSAGLLKATSDFSHTGEQDILIITVGTPLTEDNTADLSAIRHVAATIAPYIKPGVMIILKSTVVPRTTLDVFAKTIEEQAGLSHMTDYHLAFSPERIAEGQAVRELHNIPVVVGAERQDTADLICDFWQDSLGVETIALGSTVAAELTKLANNVWIDTNIALANLLSKLCHDYDVNFKDIAHAANSLPKGQHNVNILTSSIGVGGSCLTKDPYFVADLLDAGNHDATYLRAARDVNDSMPAFTAGILHQWVSAQGLETPRVAILGLSFKNDTNDMRYSPVVPFHQLLLDQGYKTALHDPLLTMDEIEQYFNQSGVEDPYEAAKDADILCFGCGHSSFLKLDLNRLKQACQTRALFIDGRKAFNPDDVLEAGFQYVAI